MLSKEYLERAEEHKEKFHMAEEIKKLPLTLPSPGLSITVYMSVSESKKEWVEWVNRWKENLGEVS